MAKIASRQMRIIDLSAFLSQGAVLSLNERFCYVGWGTSKKSGVYHPDRPAFYTSDFFLENNEPWKSFEFGGLIQTQDLIENLQNSARKTYSGAWTGPSKENWNSQFEKMKGLIGQGRLEKLVPVVEEVSETPFAVENLADALLKALQQPWPQRVYGLWQKEHGFLGVTPELLAEVSLPHRRLSTMALAGTRSVKAIGENLLTDAKEMKEHQYVIQSIIDVLTDAELKIGNTQESTFASLVHLLTWIEAEWKSVPSVAELLSRLHPTAALGVHPRHADWSILREFSPPERGVFGAPFGLHLGDTYQFVVAIRNVCWALDRVTLPSGCGIVQGSQLEKEWNELKNKRDAVKGMLFE